MKELTILGFGRFGRALADLACGAGYRVRVYDPAALAAAVFELQAPARQCAPAFSLGVVAVGALVYGGHDSTPDSRVAVGRVAL